MPLVPRGYTVSAVVLPSPVRGPGCRALRSLPLRKLARGLQVAGSCGQEESGLPLPFEAP